MRSKERLQKDREAAVAHLQKWQVDFGSRLVGLLKEVKEFSRKVQMSDAESNVKELAELQQKINECESEVCILRYPRQPH